MKPMHEISNPQDIALHRARLIGEVNKKEKKITQDVNRLRNSWNGISSIISTASTGLNWFWTGLSIFRFFRRKKR